MSSSAHKASQGEHRRQLMMILIKIKIIDLLQPGMTEKQDD